MPPLRTPARGARAPAAVRLAALALAAGCACAAFVAPPAVAPARGTVAFERVWSASLPAPAAAAPAADPSGVYVPLRNGRLVALDLATGTRRWALDLPTDAPVAAAGSLVIAASGGEIHALETGSGVRRWRAAAGPLAGPLLLDTGWAIAGTQAGDLIALRADDGAPLWRRALGAAIGGLPAIAGRQIHAPLEDGHVVALDLLTGDTVWRRRLDGPARTIVVAADRLYAGSSDQFFYCLSLRDGRILWRWRIGAEPVGAPVVDAERVVFTAFDNVLRAVDPRSGVQRWRRPLPVRPLAGPLPSGDVLLVAGAAAQMRAYYRDSGEPAGDIALPAALVAPPTVIAGAAAFDIQLVAATGALTGEWQIHAYRRSLYPGPVPLERLLGPPDPLPERSPGGQERPGEEFSTGRPRELPVSISWSRAADGVTQSPARRRPALP